MQFLLSTPSYKFNQIESNQISFITKASLSGMKLVDQRHYRYKIPPEFCDYLVNNFYPPKLGGCSIPRERQLGVFPEEEGRGGEERKEI